MKLLCPSGVAGKLKNQRMSVLEEALEIGRVSL
jgi:hypothetical protein